MYTPILSPAHRASRASGTLRSRARRLLLGLLFSGLVVGLVLTPAGLGALGISGAGAPADAAGTSGREAVGAQASDPGFAITSPPSNTFVSGTTVGLAGTKDSGTSVVIPSLNGGDPLCVVPADATTVWSCPGITLPSGTIGLAAVEYTGTARTATSEPITLRVLDAPGVRGTGTIINAGSIDGSGWEGSSIRVIVTAPEASVQSCSTVVSDGYWYCGLTLPSGQYTVQVEQSWPQSTSDWSPPSAPRTLVIDTSIPLAPVVTAPTEGQRITAQPFTYAGTGQENAMVDVFVSSQYICTGQVTAGAWQCRGSGAPTGGGKVTAIQRNAAQSYSPPSAAVDVVFGAAPTGTPSPTATPSASASAPGGAGATGAAGAAGGTSSSTPSTTGSGAGTGTGTGTDTGGTPTPIPTGTSGAAPSPTATSGAVPPGSSSAAGPPGLPSGGGNWGTPTAYGSAIATPTSTVVHGNWATGALLAGGWLLLIALPLRLLATTLRGRIRLARPKLTGRNHRVVREDAAGPAANPSAVAVGALLCAALLAVMASGLQNEVQYLRLTIAVAVGLTVLNIGVVLSTGAASRALGVSRVIRLAPIFLIVGTVTAIVSRAADIHPPMIVGIVISAVFAGELAPRPRGTVQLAQIGALAVLATGAWLLLGAIGPVDGFWMSALSETLSAMCLAGLGSAVLLMLPVMRLPGRAILEWSPAIWLVTTLVVATLAATILTEGQFPVLLMAGGAAVLATVSVASWGWVRFVEPSANGAMTRR